jgi:prevent-host-death family protein
MAGAPLDDMSNILYSDVQSGDQHMKTVSFTEFRNHASDMLTEVEHGETLIVVRHGRPIAEVTPAVNQQPSWKRPALRLSTKGAGLASAILQEREHETLP